MPRRRADLPLARHRSPRSLRGDRFRDRGFEVATCTRTSQNRIETDICPVPGATVAEPIEQQFLDGDARIAAQSDPETGIT